MMEREKIRTDSVGRQSHGQEERNMKIPKMKLRYVSMTGWISLIFGILLILLGCWLRLIWLIILAIFELLAAILFLLLLIVVPIAAAFWGMPEVWLLSALRGENWMCRRNPERVCLKAGGERHAEIGKSKREK